MSNWDVLIEFIDQELSSRDWNRAELSRRSKISEAHISRVMSRIHSPGNEFCEKIAKAFDCPVDKIFRKAGILPPIPESTEQIDDLIYLFGRFPEEEKTDLLNFI